LEVEDNGEEDSTERMRIDDGRLRIFEKKNPTLD